MAGFRWTLGSYVGGDTAVHQAYKTYLVLQPEEWAIGEVTIQARDTTDLVVSGLGFQPTAIVLISYRPKYANFTTDSAFGARGGGMSYGVAAFNGTAAAWNAITTYDPGDTVEHENIYYTANVQNTNDEPPSASWDVVTTSAQFSGTTKIRHAFATRWSKWVEDACLIVAHTVENVEILRLSVQSFDADGFTLAQEANLYDQTNPVAWLAMRGNFQAGCIDAGAPNISGFDGTPTGAMFLSTRQRAADGEYRPNEWDHMQGFASASGAQNCIWGGRRLNSWDWSTERWTDNHAILLCAGATGGSFAGASVLVEGDVRDWHAGGIDLSWPTYNSELYRIGYLLCGDPAEVGYLETNWETRPGGTQNDPPGSGYNYQVTGIDPDVVLMAATNYTFSYANTDPFDRPREPDTFQSGGSGGLGWHAQPFSSSGTDAYGVHTFGNGVAERGHYSNSGTQYLRNCIMAGQGANSNPPAYHQHCVNIIPNPRWVGMNWRYAERHTSATRALQGDR